MAIATQAVHCVSWEPLSGQDMGLVWRPQSMHSHKKVITSLFRESLCVRMRISSLVRTPDSARSRVGLKSALCPALDSIFEMGGPQAADVNRSGLGGRVVRNSAGISYQETKTALFIHDGFIRLRTVVGKY